MNDDYGLGVTVTAGFEQVVARTRVALRSKGFGILSEMRTPPAVGEFPGRSHLFMSVWEQMTSAGNLGGPGLDVTDHLPCNVVVFEDGDSTSVAVLDPAEGLEGWAEVSVALEARKALEGVLEEVASAPEA